MEKSRPQSTCAGYSRGARDLDIPKLPLHEELRHTQVETRAITSAIGRPRNSGVDQGSIALAQNDYLACLVVLPYASNLCNDNASSIFRPEFRRRELVEREGAGGKESELQACYFAPLDGPVERKVLVKSELAIATNLPRVP